MTDIITTSTGLIAPILITYYTVNRAIRNVVHPILGSSVPDISLRKTVLRSGEMTLLMQDHDRAIRAMTLLTTSPLLALTSDDPTASMTFALAPGDLKLTPDEDYRRFLLVVPFQEVPQ